MRFLMIVKANKDSEAGALPSEELLSAMMKFNEDLANAGMLLDLNGLQPSSKGARVTFKNGTKTVTDGPFVETNELVAGYWLIKADSLQQAIDWAKRVPFTDDSQIEIRQVHELEDFGPSKAIDDARRLEQERATLK